MCIVLAAKFVFICYTAFCCCYCCSVTKACLTLCNPMNCSTQLLWPSLFLRICSNSCPLSDVIYFILCCSLLLSPSMFPSIRVFSNESALHIMWPKYWSFSFSISPSNKHSGLISFRIDWLISLQSKGLSRVFSSTTIQKHPFSGAQPSLWSNSHICTWPLGES